MCCENEVLKELRDRRSVRAFTGAPIPPEARQAILEAAAQAPSAGCQQLYTILDIQDPARKAPLSLSLPSVILSHCAHSHWTAGAFNVKTHQKFFIDRKK